MRRRLCSASVVSGIVVTAAVLLAGGSAKAFLGVADTGDALLAQLIANGVQQLSRLGEAVDVARKTYDEGRKVAGYAEDAHALAASFHEFNIRRFGEHLRRDLEAAYPDAAYYRDQVEGGRWPQGGRLTDLVRHCVDGTLRRDQGGRIHLDSDRLCTDVREEVGSSRALVAVGEVFGIVPSGAATTPSGRQAEVIDAEVAAQLAAQTSQWNRTQRVKQVVEQMQADCTRTSDGSGASAACEAGAQRAQMDVLAEQAETNRLIAEQTRVLALQLEQRNAELKRDLGDALARRSALGGLETAPGAEPVAIKVGRAW